MEGSGSVAAGRPRAAPIRPCGGRRIGSCIGRPSNHSTDRRGKHTSDVLLSRLDLDSRGDFVWMMLDDALYSVVALPGPKSQT
jgi:hypothetical protein